MGEGALQVIHQIGMSHYRWMGWNLILALIPWGLSLWLFQRSPLHKRSWVWWLGFLAFLAFLPNAPYVLTDVVHLINWIRWGSSVWVTTLLLFPLYIAFILVGWEAYVLSLMNLGSYLERQGSGGKVLGMELIIHALSAIGVYLGRFRRFNSWDILTNPDQLTATVIDDLASHFPLRVILITFIVIAILYGIFKFINLALISYWQLKSQKNQGGS